MSTAPVTELLAPAGSVDAGLAAFQAGANAIYVGLPRFSARSGAINCTLEDLRRLKRAALQCQGAIYLTVNTLVRQEELPDMLRSVQEAAAAGVDAVIIQDIGVARVLKAALPQLPLHASTQLAVHNAAGVREAARLGFTRVVLARECGLSAIRRIREACPEMELEVFIHGALCYSFSGLCLTSGLLLGRSGNRGECAQLCRNWYETPQGKAYALSCNDLALEEDILGLQACGVRSFKIEGRMKGPEYVYHSVHLYRQILDAAAQGKSIDPKVRSELLRNTALTFQRQKTKAYFKHASGNQLIGRDFAGHQGVAVGEVERVSVLPGKSRQLEVAVRLTAPVSRHDGVMWFPSGNAFRPVRTSIAQLEVAGKPAIHAKPGESVRIRLAIEAAEEAPIPGDRFFQIMSSDLTTPRVNPNSLKPWKTPVAVKVRLASSAETFPDNTATLSLSLPEAEAGETWQFPVTLDRASVARSFVEVLRTVLDTEASSSVQVSELSFENATQLADNALFVPPSELKRMRQAFYPVLEQWLEKRREARAAFVLEGAEAPQGRGELLPRRDFSPAFAPVAENDALALPFVDEEDLESLAQGGTQVRLAEWKGMRMLPLSPVMVEDDRAFAALQTLVSGSDPEVRWCLGINNVAQLEWLRNLLAKVGPSRLSWWVDAYLYATNDWVVRSLRESLGPEVPEPVGVMPWVEDEESRGQVSYLPYMISMGCLKRHGLEGSRCPPACSRNFLMPLRNGDRVFRAVVRHCRTYLF